MKRRIISALIAVMLLMNVFISFDFRSNSVKAATTPGVSYQAYVQKQAWQNWSSNGKLAGTTGKGLRIEALRIRLDNAPYAGSIKFRTYGRYWSGWHGNDGISGSIGMGQKLEAIQIRLTLDMLKHYDVYYAVHVQSIGWMKWKKNGEVAGIIGRNLRIEGIKIKLVKKGSKAPAEHKGAVDTVPASIKTNDEGHVTVKGVTFDTRQFTDKTVTDDFGETVRLTPDRDIDLKDVTFVINGGNADMRCDTYTGAYETMDNFMDWSVNICYESYYEVSDWNNPIATVFVRHQRKRGWDIPGVSLSVSPMGKKGNFNVVAYYKGAQIAKCKFTVACTDDDYTKMKSELAEIEKQVWKDGMTDREKIDAVSSYIRRNYTYEQRDCKGGVFMLYFAARDLGYHNLKYRYVSTWDEKEQRVVYDYKVGFAESYFWWCMGNYGHTVLDVKIDGEWVMYQTQGGKPTQG